MMRLRMCECACLLVFYAIAFFGGICTKKMYAIIFIDSIYCTDINVHKSSRYFLCKWVCVYASVSVCIEHNDYIFSNDKFFTSKGNREEWCGNEGFDTVWGKKGWRECVHTASIICIWYDKKWNFVRNCCYFLCMWRLCIVACVRCTYACVCVCALVCLCACVCTSSDCFKRQIRNQIANVTLCMQSNLSNSIVAD